MGRYNANVIIGKARDNANVIVSKATTLVVERLRLPKKYIRVQRMKARLLGGWTLHLLRA